MYCGTIRSNMHDECVVYRPAAKTILKESHVVLNPTLRTTTPQRIITWRNGTYVPLEICRKQMSSNDWTNVQGKRFENLLEEGSEKS